MSHDSILKRYGGQTPETRADPVLPELEQTDDLGCFGLIRSWRDRAPCLELRCRSGSILAINYSYISRFEYEPSVGISLHTGTGTVTIAGRNLNHEVRPEVRLFESIARFRVPWIMEAGRAEALASGMKVVVESIRW